MDNGDCEWFHTLHSSMVRFGLRILPTRGLRQGDPLSLYLFLFVVDVLSRNIIDSVQSRRLYEIGFYRYCPIVSHLLFANDSLFFFVKVNYKNCKVFIDLVQDYCHASGKLVNYEKSIVVFNNTTSELNRQIQQATSIAVSDNPGVYLGIPAVWGR